jgi:hypothetical protein
MGKNVEANEVLLERADIVNWEAQIFGENRRE